MARLKAAGVGRNEMLPLERVLEAAYTHQSGKLREIRYCGLSFEPPEFPRMPGNAVVTLPPAELGENIVKVLAAAGLSESARAALLASGTVREGG